MEKPVKESRESSSDQTKLSELPILIIKGFLMGSADIVPGVSGGTMALITGIYERLLNAIKSVNKASIFALLRFRLKDFSSEFHWLFLSGLLSGIAGAVIFFTRIIPLPDYMYKQPEVVYGLFFGLILGSIRILVKGIPKWTVKEWMGLIVGAVFGFWIVTLVPADTPENPAFIFLSGMIAICAMILPGISGSYLLLMLRKYEFILSQIGLLGSNQSVDAFLILLPFGFGALAGITLFSRVLSWLLNRFHNVTMAVLVGFLIGSLYVIWPFQQREYVRIEKQEIIAHNEALGIDSFGLPADTLLPRFSYYEQLPSGKIQLTQVKRKQLSVKPYFPEWPKNTAFFHILWVRGMGGMITGLLLVLLIERLRPKS